MDQLLATDLDEGDCWNGALYQNVGFFDPSYADDLLELLDAAGGERVLDFGCGTGELTARIANDGAEVVGIDTSADMLGTAREAYPYLDFHRSTAAEHNPERPYDALFSNAVLHWIPELGKPLLALREMLRSGGRFVGEFSANKNIEIVREALHAAVADLGYDPGELDPWNFPTRKEYVCELEKSGFEVRQARILKRAAVYEGEEGFRLWLAMFGGEFLTPLSLSERRELITNLEAKLRDQIYRDNRWIFDYRRLRFFARKSSTPSGLIY